MGYTHYYPLSDDLDHDEFEEYKADVAALAANSDVKLGRLELYPDPDNRQRQPFEYERPEAVYLNGFGEQSHETFAVPRDRNREEMAGKIGDEGEEFVFCKTARKPYDEIVCAALIELERRFPDAVDVRSDGYFDNDLWLEGIELYIDTFPDRELPSKFDV